MYTDIIVIEDSGKNQYTIDRDNEDAMKSFTQWFKSIYIKGIPQVLTIIDYSIARKNDDESFYLVNKIICPSSSATHKIDSTEG